MDSAPDYDSLFHAHYATVHARARLWGLSEPDAEDLAQTVWITVHRKLREYDSRKEFLPWLLGITYQTARNFRKTSRRWRRLCALAIGAERLPAECALATPEDALRHKQRQALAAELIQALEPDRRTVFLMAEVDKVRHADIAAVLDIPIAAVASRLRHAWDDIEAAIELRRLTDQIPVTILAGGLTTLVALSAEAQESAWRRISLRIASRRCVRAAATVCLAGMLPMSGAVLPALGHDHDVPAQVTRLSEQTGVHPPLAGESQPPVPSRAAESGVVPASVTGGALRTGYAGNQDTQRDMVRENLTVVHLRERTDNRGPPASAQAAMPTGLAGELLQLQRVWQAVRAGQFDRARRELERYDQIYPRGVLGHERAQLWAEIARGKSGAGR